MRPTREGRVTPQRAGLVFKGIGFDPEAVTTDPEPPTDRASLGEAYIPFLNTGDAELVQSKTGVTAGGAVAAPGVTVTLDAAPTLGNVLVAFVAEDDDSGPAFTLTNGTWTQIGSTVYSGNGTNWPLRMYRQTVTGSTVQATQVYNAAGGTGSLRVAILELSGADTVDADIGSASNTATTTDTITPTGSLPAVLVSGAFFRSGTPAPAGSMTELAEIGTTSKLAVNYQEVASTTGSYTVGSTGAGVNSSMIGAAFENTGDSVIWVIAPLTIDDDDATFTLVLEEGIDAAAGVFWRGSLADSYLIGSTDIVVGIETAGANTITVQAGNEADYSDAVTIATIPFTATGTYTAQTVSDSWTPTAVYRFWQLVLTTTSNVNVYEVALLDAETGGGGGVTDHEDLTGRDAADQHPADAVEYDNAGSGLTATEVQAAIDEVVLTVDDGTTSVSPVNSIVFDGATVTDDTGGQVTVEITGGGSSGPNLELDYVQITSDVSPTATTEATANTVVTGSAVTYDGSTSVVIEFFTPQAFPDLGAATRSMLFWLYDGSSSIGALGATSTPAASNDAKPVHTSRRLTPSAGSHTYSIRASVSAGTGTIRAGAGGSGANSPAFIRITRANGGAALGTPPGASVYKSSDQLNLTAATPAKVTFDSTYYDTDAYFDNANDRFVVPAGMAGKYLVSGVVVFTGYGATSTGAQAQVRINGVSSSTSERWFFREDLLGSAGEMDVPFAMMLNLVAGDYVEIWVNPGSRSDVDIRSLLFMTNFAITRLGGSEQTGQGTAFPSGPATSQRYFRTDLGMEFYYDGTRWLSMTLFTTSMIPSLATTTTTTGDLSSTIAATSNVHRAPAPSLQGGSDIWLVSHRVVFNVTGGGTALGASHKWVATFKAVDLNSASLGTQATTNVDSGSSGVYREATTAIGALKLAGTFWYLTTWTKTGTPGNLITGEQFTYRIVAT